MLGAVGGRTEASSSRADVEHKLESPRRARGHAHHEEVWFSVPGVVSWHYINHWIGALDRDVLAEEEFVCEERSVGASLE